jgi:hypothetical protein
MDKLHLYLFHILIFQIHRLNWLLFSELWTTRDQHLSRSGVPIHTQRGRPTDRQTARSALLYSTFVCNKFNRDRKRFSLFYRLKMKLGII